jgi:hypothetical protein
MNYSVFVSYTFEDLQTYQEAVGLALRETGMTNLEVTLKDGKLADHLEISRLALHKADIFLGIYASRYGALIEDHDLSLTEHLYSEACLLGIPRFIYVVSPEQRWADDYLKTGYEGAQMRLFLDRLHQENPHLRFFTTPVDLGEKITLDLMRYRQQSLAVHRFVRRHFLAGMLLVYAVILGIVWRFA